MSSAIQGQTNIAMENRKIHHLKMYSLLEKVDFHCHVSLLEGKFSYWSDRLPEGKIISIPWYRVLTCEIAKTLETKQLEIYGNT